MVMLECGGFEVCGLRPDALGWIAAFLRRYAPIRPDVADASLMYLAEARGLAAILTLDRRDFSIYQKENGDLLTMLP